MGKTVKTYLFILLSLTILGFSSSCMVGDHAGGIEVGNPGPAKEGSPPPPDSQPKPKEQQNLLAPSDCESKNGIIVLAPSMVCPKEEKLIGEIKAGVETAVCCESPVFTIPECEERGGNAIADLGDGRFKHCDDNHYKIGNIDSDFFEGGICCVLKKN